ncbi:MAG: addiction module toxin RelE [Thermodesulfobacteriota bacterium]|nr:addiction module toxin RelE [Thermodesulfobacteriota bacterium]
MNCNVRLVPSARKDFNKLDGREKLAVAKKLKKLSSNPFLGEKLGKRAGIDLIGYFKLYADKKRLRIVYRCIGDPVDLEVIAVGPKEGLAVYRKTEKRRGEK